MRFTSKLIILILFYLSFLQNSFSDNHNIYETLEIIKNDLKTLERAVYSGSIEIKTSANDQVHKKKLSNRVNLKNNFFNLLIIDQVMIKIMAKKRPLINN